MNRKSGASLLMAAMTAFLICVPYTAAAAAMPVKPTKEYTYDDAAHEIAEALKAIDSVYYFKDTLDYKEIADAAIAAAFDQLDTYSEYMTKSQYEEFHQYAVPNKAGIGIEIRRNGEGYFWVRKVFKGSPAESAGVLKDDVITRIDGLDVKNKELMEIRDMLIGDKGTQVSLTVRRNGAERSLAAKRGLYVMPLAERLDISALVEGADKDKTAYVVISSFASNEKSPENDTAKQFERIYNELKKENVKNLIIDLRDNSGGDVAAAIDIGELLVKKGKMFTLKYLNQPSDTFYSANEKAPEFNVAVLVNGATASASEVLAVAIQESGAGVIVGSETFGKGIGQMTIPTADGSHIMKLTVTEIVTGKGNALHGVGVTPDVEVEPPPWIEAYDADEINYASPKEHVEQLRASLAYLGYSAGAIGAGYDSSLAEAVKAFQKAAGVTVNGVCDFPLISRINDYINDKYIAEDTALKKAYTQLNK